MSASFVNLGYTHIPAIAFDREVIDIAITTVDLQRIRAHFFRHFAGEELGYRGLLAAMDAGCAQACRMEHELARDFKLGRHVIEFGQQIGAVDDRAVLLEVIRLDFRSQFESWFSAYRHHYLIDTEAGIINAQAIMRVTMDLKDAGFKPDIMLGHNGGVEIWYLKKVFPNSDKCNAVTPGGLILRRWPSAHMLYHCPCHPVRCYTRRKTALVGGCQPY